MLLRLLTPGLEGMPPALEQMQARFYTLDSHSGMWVEKEVGRLLESVDTVQEARGNRLFLAHFSEKNKQAFKSCSQH